MTLQGKLRDLELHEMPRQSKIVLTGALLTHRNTDYFTSYLTDAHAKLKKPIWLTEFMGRGTLEEQKKFLEFAVPWLEKQDFIERYAVFGAFDDGNEWANFFNKDGSLTDLGKTYASL